MQRLGLSLRGDQPHELEGSVVADGLDYGAIVFIGPRSSPRLRAALWRMIGSLRFPHLRAHTFVNGAYALGAWRIPGRVVHVRARAPSVRGTVLVAESYGERLTAFEIDADGGLSGRRTWADTPGHHPDGICVDAAGAVWYADVGTNRCVRVAEGGEVLDTVVLDRGCFACMLGGNDDQTLFIVAQRWGEAPDPIAPTGQVLTVRAPSPHAGRP